MTRVAVIRDPSVPAGSGGFAAIQTVAPSLRVELTPVGVRDGAEIDHAIAAFARSSNGGLIVVGPGSSVAAHRDLIITPPFVRTALRFNPARRKAERAGIDPIR